MAEPLSDPRTYFKFQSCGRCFYKPCDGLRYGGVIAGKFLFVHNSHLGLGFFDCPFTVQAFDEVERLTEGLSSSELDSRLNDAFGMMTPAQTLQYRMDDYIADYSDFGGRIAFIKALWDDQVISILRIPLFFTADPKMRKWLYANENLMYSLKKTVVDDGLSGAAATDSMAAKKQTKSAAPEADAAPENMEDTDPVLTEIEVFVEGKEGPRKVTSGGTLEIVPDLLIGKKITCREVKGVPVTWKATGCFLDEKTGSEADFQIKGWPKIAHAIWFPNEKPHSATITAKDKHGNQLSVQLYVFSGSKELLEFNFIKIPVWKKWNEIKDKLENLIEQAIGQKIEIKLLEGGVSYSANFKESKEEKVFFSYDMAGGFNPLMSIEMKVPFGNIPGPKILEKYFKLIKFEFIANGAVGLNFHFSKSDVENHKAELTCEPKFEFGIEGSSHIEAQIITKKIIVIDAKLNAMSGLEGSFGGFTEGEGLGIQGELSWSGLKASGYIEALDGRFKYSKEITFIDSITLLKGEKLYFVNSRSDQQSVE